MTEPVAYMWKTAGGNVLGFQEYKEDIPYPGYVTPLYTAEDLHPRVKMTKKQYDRLMWDKENTDLFQCLDYFHEHDGVNNFGLPSENLMGLLTQEDIARAWLNPEETIEIIPEKKWFVRSKKAVGENNFYAWLFNNDFLDVPAHMISDEIPPLAMKFDTKEQAEKWTNPLTEAVQLAVEGK